MSRISSAVINHVIKYLRPQSIEIGASWYGTYLCEMKWECFVINNFNNSPIEAITECLKIFMRDAFSELEEEEEEECGARLLAKSIGLNEAEVLSVINFIQLMHREDTRTITG